MRGLRAENSRLGEMALEILNNLSTGFIWLETFLAHFLLRARGGHGGGGGVPEKVCKGDAGWLGKA